MENETILLLLTFIFTPRATRRDLPPSPLSLPFVGHLHLIKAPTHRTFLKLTQKYRPVISLRFRSRLLVVVSSSSTAEECFTKNDIVLANRPRLLRGKYLGYNYSTLVDLPYGDHWRNQRRKCATEIFSPNRLNVFPSVRKDEIKRLLLKLSHDSHEEFAKVELKLFLTDLTFNNIMRMITGKRCCAEADDTESRELRQLIAEAFQVGGATNPGDFLPIWNLFNGKFVKRLKNISGKVDAFAGVG